MNSRRNLLLYIWLAALAALSAYYTLALVLVWLRVMYDFQDYLFFYVQNEDMRDATREWASWVIPLLVVEFWISWLPQMRPNKPNPLRASA